MSERSTGQERPKTPEYWQTCRQEVAGLREQKGAEAQTLRLAHLYFNESASAGEHEHAVNFLWEQYLVGKHFLMAGRDERSLGRIKRIVLMAKGFSLMARSAKKADDYIRGHGVENLRPRSHRFLGEIDMLSHRYSQAVDHFQTGVGLFQKMSTSEQRVNGLELSGFLAEALVLSGKTGEGIEVAQETFRAYENGDGEELKKRDYYTWAVWRSGCAAKVWNALLKTKSSIPGSKRKGLNLMLLEAEKILVFPNGEASWGDKNFAIRKTEITAIKEKAVFV